jgi:uncharacterized protein (DUF1499 family)
MTQQNVPPRLLNWVAYIGITFTLLLPIAVLTVRSGAWQPGLGLYALACLGSALLIILCMVLLLLPRFSPWRRSLWLRALIVLPGTLLLFSLLTTGGKYPPIHDITTDTENPPSFSAAAGERGEGANPLDIDGQTITQQQEAYPDIKTLQSALSVEDAFNRSLEIANSLQWEVYHQDRAAGVIEAVATTGTMAFKDDVVIRISDNNSGSLVDLRSVSRVGVGDIGANALRIRAFRKAFQPIQE